MAEISNGTNPLPKSPMQPLRSSYDDGTVFNARDDMELVRLSGGSETHNFGAGKSNKLSFLVFRLESQLKSASKIVHEINTKLVDSTTAEILQYKPITDAERLKVNNLVAWVEAKHQAARTMGKPKIELCEVAPLNDQAAFAEWNEIATKINNSVESINANLRLDGSVAERSNMTTVSAMPVARNTDDSSLFVAVFGKGRVSRDAGNAEI